MKKMSGPAINTKTFSKQLEQLLSDNLKKIDAMLATHHTFTWDVLMHPLECMHAILERFWSPLSHLHSVMDSADLRQCYEACLPQLSAYHTTIGQNAVLYQAIQRIDTQRLNPVQRKIIADYLRDFRLTGVALAEDKKRQFEVVEQRLSHLCNQFANHILDATQAFVYLIEEQDKRRLTGLPKHAIARARALASERKQTGWLFNLETPSYLAIITYAEDRDLRETFYHAYVTRASDCGPHAGKYDNAAIMQEILCLRHEKAKLLGFSDYTAYSLATKMADTSEQVVEFLMDLSQRTYPQAKQEFNALRDYAQTQFGYTTIAPWDIAYVSEKRKQALFSISEEALREYFPLPKVLQGLFAIVQQLFGMRIEQDKSCEMWHPDVICYTVLDEQAMIRGYLYLDLFARPHKRGGAWQDSGQTRFQQDKNHLQLPISFLTCNFATPEPGKIPTLSHSEVETLFHEFGHCLHHVLTQVEYWSVAGTNGVEWDAVELPSQFLENWCWNAEAIQKLSAHVKTGDVLPESQLQQLLAAKNFQSGLSLMRQIEFALFDFLLHKGFDGHQDDMHYIQDTITAVRQTTTVVPVAEFNRFANSFSHIFAGGYAAGYYSYLWAAVLSSDAFSRFEEEGVFNAKTGHDFLHEVLEVGGGCTAAKAFEAFRGRKPSIEAMLRHLQIGAD